MVEIKLINYDKVNQAAYYCCYPEGDIKKGFDIVINPIKRELVATSLKESNAYLAHATWRLYEIIEETQALPEFAVAIWY